MAQQNITLVINVAAQECAKKVQDVAEALKQMGANFDKVVINAKEAGAAVSANTRAVANNAREYGNLSQQVGASSQQFITASLAVNMLTGAFRMMYSQWRHALDVNLQLTAAQRMLNVSTGDGAAAFDWVKEKAYEYGLVVSQVAQQYGVFNATAKFTNLTMKESKDIFEAFTLTASALGMGVQESDRLFYALREILNKNQLRSEELVRQLGNTVPGAVRRAIQAFGQGEEAFRKAMQAGEIRGQVMLDWLKKFAQGLREDFAGAAKEGAESLQGSLAKMKDAIELLYLEIGKGDGFFKLNEAIRGVADKLREPATLAQMRQLGDTLGTLGKVAAGCAKFAYEWRYALIGLAAAIPLIKLKNWLTQLVQSRIQILLNAKATYDKIVADKLEAITIPQTTAATTQETVARQQNIRAIIQERLEINKNKLTRLEGIALRRTVINQLFFERKARLENAVATDQERLAKLRNIQVTTGLKTALTALGGPMMILNIAIMAGTMAWGYYAKKVAEAKAKQEEMKIKAQQVKEGMLELTGKIVEYNKILTDSKTKVEEYNKAEAAKNVAIDEFKEAFPDFYEMLSDRLDIAKATNKELETEIELMATQQAMIAIKAEETRDKYKNSLDDLKRITKLSKEARGIYDKRILADITKKYGGFWETESNALEKLTELYQAANNEANKQVALVSRMGAAKEAMFGEKDKSKPPETPESKKSKDKPFTSADINIKLMKSELERFKATQDITDELKIQEKINKVEAGRKQKLMELEISFAEKMKTLDEDHASGKYTNEKEFQKLWKDAIQTNADDEIRINREAQAEIKNIKQSAWEDAAKLQQTLQDKIVLAETEKAEKVFEKTRIEIRKLEAEAMQTAKNIRAAGGSFMEFARLLRLAADARKAMLAEASNKVKENYMKEMEKQINEIKRIKKSLTQADIEAVFVAMRLEAGKSEEAIKALNEAIEELRAKLESSLPTTFLGQYLKHIETIKDHTKNLADMAISITQGIESQLSSGFQSIFERGVTGAEKWKNAMEGLKNAFVKAIGDMIAKTLVYLTIGKAVEALTTTGAKKTVAEGSAKVTAHTVAAAAATAEAIAQGALAATEATGTVAATQLAAANIFLAHSFIPFAGVGMATAMVAEMNAALAASLAAAQGMAAGMIAFAKGGVIDKPTIALMGEAGQREFVAPEIDFFDWSERLAYNIMRRQDEANAYREYTANIIRQADEGGMRQMEVQHHYHIDKREVESVVYRAYNRAAARI